MKKAPRAAKSASESQLRSNATSYLARKRGRNLVRAAAIARIVKGADDAARAKKSGKKDYIDVEEITPSKKSAAVGPGRQFVQSERVPRQVGGPAKPRAALPAPSPAPKAGPKKPRGSKKERIPGMQRVFKATPVVDLNEGPNFGNIKHSVEETFQPKPPKRKKNA